MNVTGAIADCANALRIRGLGVVARFREVIGGISVAADWARASDYVAEFERIGRQALRWPEWRGRLRLFNVCFLGGADSRRTIRLAGVAEGTFDDWYRDV